jgi:hypothetical protein
MKLREEFTFNCRECDFEENAIQCEKIADDYAIEFAEWLDTLKPNQRVSFWSKNGEHKGKFDMDNEQLLEIFKREKQY